VKRWVIPKDLSTERQKVKPMVKPRLTDFETEKHLGIQMDFRWVTPKLKEIEMG
jgi:hypothetical protein